MPNAGARARNSTTDFGEPTPLQAPSHCTRHGQASRAHPLCQFSNTSPLSLAASEVLAEIQGTNAPNDVQSVLACTRPASWAPPPSVKNNRAADLSNQARLSHEWPSEFCDEHCGSTTQQSGNTQPAPVDAKRISRPTVPNGLAKVDWDRIFVSASGTSSPSDSVAPRSTVLRGSSQSDHIKPGIESTPPSNIMKPWIMQHDRTHQRPTRSSGSSNGVGKLLEDLQAVQDEDNAADENELQRMGRCTQHAPSQARKHCPAACSVHKSFSSASIASRPAGNCFDRSDSPDELAADALQCLEDILAQASQNSKHNIHEQTTPSSNPTIFPPPIRVHSSSVAMHQAGEPDLRTVDRANHAELSTLVPCCKPLQDLSRWALPHCRSSPLLGNSKVLSQQCPGPQSVWQSASTGLDVLQEVQAEEHYANTSWFNKEPRPTNGVTVNAVPCIYIPTEIEEAELPPSKYCDQGSGYNIAGSYSLAIWPEEKKGQTESQDTDAIQTETVVEAVPAMAQQKDGIALSIQNMCSTGNPLAVQDDSDTGICCRHAAPSSNPCGGSQNESSEQTNTGIRSLCNENPEQSSIVQEEPACNSEQFKPQLLVQHTDLQSQRLTAELGCNLSSSANEIGHGKSKGENGFHHKKRQSSPVQSPPGETHTTSVLFSPSEHYMEACSFIETGLASGSASGNGSFGEHCKGNAQKSKEVAPLVMCVQGDAEAGAGGDAASRTVATKAASCVLEKLVVCDLPPAVRVESAGEESRDNASNSCASYHKSVAPTCTNDSQVAAKVLFLQPEEAPRHTLSKTTVEAATQVVSPENRSVSKCLHKTVSVQDQPQYNAHKKKHNKMKGSILMEKGSSYDSGTSRNAEAWLMAGSESCGARPRASCDSESADSVLHGIAEEPEGSSPLSVSLDTQLQEMAVAVARADASLFASGPQCMKQGPLQFDIATPLDMSLDSQNCRWTPPEPFPRPSALLSPWEVSLPEAMESSQSSSNEHRNAYRHEVHQNQNSRGFCQVNLTVPGMDRLATSSSLASLGSSSPTSTSAMHASRAVCGPSTISESCSVSSSVNQPALRAIDMEPESSNTKNIQKMQQQKEDQTGGLNVNGDRALADYFTGKGDLLESMLNKVTPQKLQSGTKKGHKDRHPLPLSTVSTDHRGSRCNSCSSSSDSDTDLAPPKARASVSLKRSPLSNCKRPSDLERRKSELVSDRGDCALCGRAACCTPDSCFCTSCSARMDHLESPSPADCTSTEFMSTVAAASKVTSTLSTPGVVCSQQAPKRGDPWPSAANPKVEVSSCVLCGSNFVCSADAQSSVLCQQCLGPATVAVQSNICFRST